MPRSPARLLTCSPARQPVRRPGKPHGAITDRQPSSTQSILYCNRVETSPPLSPSLHSTDALCTTALFRAADQGAPFSRVALLCSLCSPLAVVHWFCCCFRPFQLRAAAHNKVRLSPPLCCTRAEHSTAPHCNGAGAWSPRRANLADRNLWLIAGPARPFLLAGDDARKPSSTRFRTSIFVIGLISPHLTRKPTRQSH